MESPPLQYDVDDDTDGVLVGVTAVNCKMKKHKNMQRNMFEDIIFAGKIDKYTSH